MANYIVSDTDMTSLADAIREKSGGSESIVWPNGFLTAMQGITSGYSFVESVRVAYNNTGSYNPSEITAELDQTKLYILRRSIFKSYTGTLEIWLIYHNGTEWVIYDAIGTKTCPESTASISGNTLTFKNMTLTSSSDRPIAELRSIGVK